jgi:8-oxo-dGTP pyrophosphatase MutT (NUDIX family)
VLHIRCLALDEPGNSSLADAALRELQQEAGIPAEFAQPLPELAGRPIEIDLRPSYGADR